MNLNQNRTRIACPICSDKNEKETFTVSRDDPFSLKNSKKAEYSICGNCGLMILDDDDDYEKIYSDGGHYTQSEQDSPERFIEERFKKVISLPEEQSDNFQRVNRINKFIKSHFDQHHSNSKNVLDIGGGLGVFIHKFLKPDWSATIIEPVAYACHHLEKVLPNVKIVNGYLSDLKTEVVFDLITLNRVLEHIYDPLPLLEGCKRYLNNSGLLYIEVPDTESFYLDGENNEAFGYGHYYVYSIKSFELLMKKTGYEILGTFQTKEPSGKYTLYGFFRKK